MGTHSIPACLSASRGLPLALSLALALAAGASPGCATASAGSPTLDLAAPAGPPAASEWSTWADPVPARVAASPAARAALDVGGRWISHVSLLGGGRWMDESDWGTLDQQLIAGLELDESFAETGNGYEAGLLYSEDEDEFEFTSYELYGGYRRTFGAATDDLHPFVSVGLSATQGELEVSGPGVDDSDDDVVLGAYVRAGLLWDVSERVRLGLDYRRLFAQDFEFELVGSELDAEGNSDQVVLSLGFEF